MTPTTRFGSIPSISKETEATGGSRLPADGFEPQTHSATHLSTHRETLDAANPLYNSNQAEGYYTQSVNVQELGAIFAEVASSLLRLSQ